MKRLIFAFTLGVSALLAIPVFALANVSCQPIYGGGQNCVQTSIVINKTVQNPQTGNYVDNLTLNDPKYNPGQSVNFQISITNSGNTAISQTTVTDTFPQDVNFTSGPGSFNSQTNTLSFEVDNLNINETRTFTITGQVVSNDKLPQDSGVICVVNQANALADTGDNAQDNAQLCIQKTASNAAPQPSNPAQTITKGGLTVYPAPKIVATPPTGPEALPLLALLPTGFIGFLIRKRYNLV